MIIKEKQVQDFILNKSKTKKGRNDLIEKGFVEICNPLKSEIKLGSYGRMDLFENDGYELKIFEIKSVKLKPEYFIQVLKYYYALQKCDTFLQDSYIIDCFILVPELDLNDSSLFLLNSKISIIKYNVDINNGITFQQYRNAVPDKEFDFYNFKENYLS